EQDGEIIINALGEILEEIERGEFRFQVEFEDIHMNIEHRLLEKIGPAGGKLHTARSRNDQIALDVRLYLRDQIDRVLELLSDLKKRLIQIAEANEDTVLPGYTHLQRAQAVLFAHHLLAYFDMFSRDEQRFRENRSRVNIMPLGSGALAGTNYPLDRSYVAELLGFEGVTANSLDAVSDRDFLIEFAAASSILMMHLSRMGEELVLWSSAEFSFIELSDAFCTGSSIMPQKKNPDVPELVRGKSSRVFGHLLSLLTLMKGLPLSYNRDLQEDKEPIFDTVETVIKSLRIVLALWGEIKINKERMFQAARESFTNATDLADYLVRKGLPFREAHHIVGSSVRMCLEKGKSLEDLTLDELKSFSPSIEQDVYEYLKLESSISQKRSYGGTSLENVRARLEEIKRELA
ncbi:MAG: argininosuccinate lyase, partial [Candidatus Tectomicrobia bacterium]|nr:argininosuccinate lyase [Candidatus Tectomicrobia bacterium]